MSTHQHLMSIFSLSAGIGSAIASRILLAVSLTETIESRQLLALDISCVAGVVGIIASAFAIWHYATHPK